MRPFTRTAFVLLLQLGTLAPAPAAALADELNPKVRTRIESIEKKLADVESAWDDGSPAIAQAYFDSVAYDFERIAKDYGGKFDASHPEYVSLKKTVDTWRTRLAKGEEKEDEGPKLDSRAKYELGGSSASSPVASRRPARGSCARAGRRSRACARTSPAS